MPRTDKFMSFQSSFMFCSLPLVLCLACISGCFQSEGPALGSVTGVVTFDGEPLVDASVSFHPESGRGSFGKTDGDGRYELQFFKNRMGASLGPHKVTITTQVWAEATRKPGAGETARSVSEAAAGQARSEMLPEHYRSRKSTILSAEVGAGENEFNFALESQ